jgi:hypothetical protein
MAMAVLAVASSSTHASPLNILFVGNSYTYGHDDPVQSYNSANVTDANGTGYGGVPGIFKQMAAQSGFACNVTIEAVADYTLKDQYENESSIIGNSQWNIVVLQGNSTEALPTARGGTPANFDTYASDLRGLVLSKNSSALLFLYETWASPTSVNDQGYDSGLSGLEEMTADLHAAYAHAGQAYGFNGVAPVGDAFLEAINQGDATYDPSNSSIPGYDLWNASDIRHASVYGSYLAAAVLYAELTGKNPTLLPYAGSAAQTFGISQANALSLEEIAEESIPEPSASALLIGGSMALLYGFRKPRLKLS